MFGDSNKLVLFFCRGCLKSLFRQVCKIANHVNEDVDALEEDGLVDELVVVMEQDGGAVEGGEPNGGDANLRVVTVVDGDVAIVVDGDLVSVGDGDDQ